MNLDHVEFKKNLYKESISPEEANRLLTKYENSLPEEELNKFDDQQRFEINGRKSMIIIKKARDLYKACSSKSSLVQPMAELKEALDLIGLGNGLDENK